MTDKRDTMRVSYTKSCELKLKGSSHHCTLANISASGAEVHCFGFLQEYWPGDKAELHLEGHGGKLDCHLTHIAASRIGMQFD